MRTGRPKALLELSEQESKELNSLARRSRSAPALARRAARIILTCAQGLDNKTVAKARAPRERQWASGGPGS